MTSRWSPYPRYRLYTRLASYALPLRQLFRMHGRSQALLQLEEEICRRFDVAAAVCVPMARTGIWLALREMIQPGQTVVMAPLTIIDVVNAVILAGGIPVFADICKSSCGMNPREAEALIDNRTGAVLITHLHGETAGAWVFQEICRRHRIPLIEDAAQAFGAVESGRHLGTVGELGIYSFGFYKNVNAWRGGMVVSNNSNLIRRIRLRVNEMRHLRSTQLLAIVLRGMVTDISTWPPIFSRFVHPIFRFGHLKGIASINRLLDPESQAARLCSLPAEYLQGMTEAQAQLALSQLDSIDEDSRARTANAAFYDKGLQRADDFARPEWKGDASNTFTYYPIRCRERSALLNHAMRNGRDFAAQHLRNCADLPAFKDFYRNCPNARAAARELTLLPTYPGYPRTEIERNIQVILQFQGTE
jgi:perosamine synthetase